MARKHYRAPAEDGVGPYVDRPIALVGMMGAGKSTIGRRLAARLNLPFIDSDEEIEAAAGRSISDIFTDFGEQEFREGERRVLQRLVDSGPCVLATGGGSFLDDETRALMLDNCITVWLSAELETLVERTSRKKTRPLLRNGNPREILARLLDERRDTYAEAHITIESNNDPHAEVVARVMAALESTIDDIQ